MSAARKDKVAYFYDSEFVVHFSMTSVAAYRATYDNQRLRAVLRPMNTAGHCLRCTALSHFAARPDSHYVVMQLMYMAESPARWQDSPQTTSAHILKLHQQADAVRCHTFYTLAPSCNCPSKHSECCSHCSLVPMSCRRVFYLLLWPEPSDEASPADHDTSARPGV